MMCTKNLFFSGILAVLSFYLPHILSAEKMVAWQAPKALAIQYEPQEELIDGMATSWLELKANGFQARWFPGGNWVVDPRASKASLTFVQHVDSGLQMQLYLYPAAGSLKNLDTPSLAAYAAFLTNHFPGMKIQTQALKFAQPKLGSLPLFDQGYWKVDYELEPANGNGEPRSVSELLTILEGGELVVLRFIGSQRFIAAIQADLSAELRRFMLE